jgi:hypothetical protein
MDAAHMSKPTLDQLIDRRPADAPRQKPHPQLRMAIGGQTYLFSEIETYENAALQAIIRETCPNPLEVVKQHIDGLPAHLQERLLDQAYRDALHWPPKIGTLEASRALLGSERGQVITLYEGLQVHHPETTREDASRIFHQLKRDARAEWKAATAEGKLYDRDAKFMKILACMFGNGDDDAPKGPGPEAASRSNGPSSSDSASNGSACGNGRSGDTP